MAGQSQEMREGVERFLREKAASTLLGMKRLGGGASQELWAVDAEIPGEGKKSLVLRTTAGGGFLSGISREDEWRLLSLAYEAGVPVPKPRWMAREKDWIGKSFYFMDLLEGETIGKKVLRLFSEEDRRKKFLAQIGKALARIHTIRPDTHDLSFLPKLAGEEHPAMATVRILEKFLDSTSFEPHPAIELGLRWVRNNLRPVAKPTLVHGDFRIGNLLVNEEGLKGVLDWELSHVGDPMEDLAWIGVRFWRFGGEKPVGGLFEWKELFSAYEAAGGFPVDPKAVRVWEILRNLWWAVGTLQQADRHLSGSQRNLELASLGRRCCEMEYEALQLVSQEEGYYPF